MKNLKNYRFAILAIALLFSCEKREEGISEEKNEVQFFAYFNENKQTKASTTFSLNNKATIYAYTSGSAPATTTPISGTPLEATAQAAGVLNPANALFVPKGFYDFYSVSLNSDTAPGLLFTSGVSGQLTNSKDYLWSKVSSIKEGGNVKFNYYHKAVCIEINISAGTGVSNLSVTSIKLSPSKPDASTKMTLATGAIALAAQKDALTTIPLTGNNGKIIMVPLQSTSLDIEVVVNGTIGGTPVTDKKYTTTIPAKEYLGGNYYTLSLTVFATSISFTGATLENWTTETIDGVTLTEQ